jgi:SAM-dependent methyltransferase
MFSYFRKTTRQQQTLSSFDYQWGRLPDGDAMLSDPWFDEQVCQILQEVTGVSACWFVGKRVLDAGCGGGRWSVGLLRLGAQVTAVDFSEEALTRTRSACAGLGWLDTLRVDLLHPPDELRKRRFDMVYSFGVLHHTGDTFAALKKVAGLVAEDGLIFLYLYGSDSWGVRQSLSTNWTRLRLAGLSFDEKVQALSRMYPERDLHQCFDLLSPTINDRLTFDEVRRQVEQLGFVDVVQTICSGEVFLRARRPLFSDLQYLTAEPVANSAFVSHYSDINRTRRDKAYERRYWELAARVPAYKYSGVSFERICERLKLSAEAFRNRNVLVVCPDSVVTARDLIAAGACVTCLAPSEKWIGDSTRGMRTLNVSVLDEPSETESRYDLVLALGSAISITRHPDLAIKRLVSRLAPNGTIVIETLLPEPETTAHKLRRLALKPFTFEQKIERLLHKHPERGLAGAFSLISSRLPLRFSESSLQSSLQHAGLSEVFCDAEEFNLLARARQCDTAEDPI